MRLVAEYFLIFLRPHIDPNDGFKLQMAKLEVKELGYTSMATSAAGKDWNFYGWNRYYLLLSENYTNDN
jgi:hypothetical protein